MAIKHSKVSAVPDGADATLVRPSDWNASHAWTEPVTATTTGPLDTPLTIEQTEDPGFVGVPALIVKAATVSAILAQFLDENDIARVKFNANSGSVQIISADELHSVTISGTNGIATDSVTIGMTGGINSAPTDSGSDGITLRGDDLVAADGGAMIRIINPVGDMPDGFYGTDTAGNLTINADMANGAAKLLVKGATIDGTIVSAYIPLTPVGGAVGGGMGNVVRISQTPTVSTTPAYTAKDAVGGLLTFANAAATAGGGIVIRTASVVDLSQQMPALDLVLFDRTFTNSTDNAIFDPTDGDLANVIGVVPLAAWSDFNDNSVATRADVGLAAELNGTDLFGQLVTRSTPTFVGTSDIKVILEIEQGT